MSKVSVKPFTVALPVLLGLSMIVWVTPAAAGQSILDRLKTIVPGTGANAPPPSGKYPVIRVSRPPDVLLKGDSMSITTGRGVAFPALDALRLAIEQGMQAEFKINSGSTADLQLTFIVTGYEPVRVGMTTQQEQRLVKVGQHACTVFGKQTTCDDFGMRAVPIQYFQASGMISVQTKVTDSHGTVVGVYAPDPKQTTIAVKRIISENGQSTLGTEALPTADSMLTQLTQKTAGLIAQAYVLTVQMVEITSLSGDRPLKTGNDLAKAGRWKDALESWRTAKTNDLADQAYNVGVGYEALAYEAFERTRQPDDSDVEALFTQAFSSYDRALQLKPREGDFLKAQGRIRESKANFERAKEQYTRQQADILKAEDESKRRREEEEGLRAARADTKDEADFRAVARVRLESESARLTPETTARLEALGKSVAYKLSDGSVKRVLFQETERVKALGEKLGLYKDQFAAAASDGVIDANDDKALSSLAQRLELTAKDVSSVESQFPATLRPAKQPVKAQTSSPAPKPPVKQTATPPPPKAAPPPTAKPPAPAPAAPAQPVPAIK